MKVVREKNPSSVCHWRSECVFGECLLGRQSCPTVKGRMIDLSGGDYSETEEERADRLYDKFLYSQQLH